MDGPERLLETIQEVMESETAQDGVNALASYAGDVASSFIPQVVRQAAQYSDGYYRDTRGATPVETAMNRLKAAIPGFSQDLPIKYNALGEPQERGGFSSIFLDPTNTMEYQPNEVTTYLEDLRTKLPDDVGFIPDRQSPMSITVNGIERVLDGTQRETYQKTYGEKVSEYYSALIKNQDFGNLSPELQAEALKKAEQYATSFAKAAVSEYKEVPEEATEELTKNIVRDTVLNSITDIFTDLNIAEEYGYDQKEHEVVPRLEDAAQKFAAFAEKKKQIGSIMGQAIDAFRIQEGTMQAANSPATAVDSFYNALDAMQEKATTFKQRKNGPDFKQWKKQIKENVARIGVAIEMVDDGDTGAMRDIIRQIAKERKTTAWFGISDRLSWNANRVLNKLGFEDLKTIANAQVAAMSDDYRARTTGDIIAGIRKQNMLTSIKTIKVAFPSLCISSPIARRMKVFMLSPVDAAYLLISSLCPFGTRSVTKS